MPTAKAVKKIDGTLRKVSLLLLEDEKNITHLLETKDGIIEYDILVWNDNYGTIFEKKGKTTKDKLKETLTFDAYLNYDYQVSLDLTVIINGKRYPFLPNSPFSNVLNEIKKRTDVEYQYSDRITVTDEKNSLPKLDLNKWRDTQDCLDFIQKHRADVLAGGVVQIEDDISIKNEEETAILEAYHNHCMCERQVLIDAAANDYSEHGYYTIPFYIIAQSVIDEIITKNFNYGKLPIVLEDVVTNVNYLESQVKTLQKEIELVKKQSLGVLYMTEEETSILDYFKNEELYTSLLNLTRGYQQTGLTNLSPYRVSVYETLKVVTDNLIVLKGKLENINFVPKTKDDTPAKK